LLKWLAPWAGPKTTLALLAVLGLLASHGAVAGYVWFKGYEARVEAVAGAKAEMREVLAREKEAHDKKVANAIEAGKNEPAVSADRAKRLRECAASPTCRNRRQ
jgi:hypothetical protein